MPGSQDLELSWVAKGRKERSGKQRLQQHRRAAQAMAKDWRLSLGTGCSGAGVRSAKAAGKGLHVASHPVHSFPFKNFWKITL